MNSAVIELNIEELVLHGFSLHDAFRIRQAVEQELTRLFMERGIPAHWSGEMEVQTPLLDMGIFYLPQNPAAGAVGNALSKTLYQGLKNQVSPLSPALSIQAHE
ncbi:MAG: hypothetical protein AAB316_24985 [Bacteroidota bacterium]